MARSGTNPITISGNPPTGMFSGGTVGNDGAIVITDANSDSVSYPYTFSAVAKGSGAPVSIDPTIENSADS